MVQLEIMLNEFSIFSSGSHFDQRIDTVCDILVESIAGIICIELLCILGVFQRIPFKYMCLTLALATILIIEAKPIVLFW